MNANTLPHVSASVLDQASVAVEQVSKLSHRGADAVREVVQEAREKTHLLGDHVVCFIKEEPVKSVLIAAATGATLMGLLSLVRNAGRG